MIKGDIKVLENGGILKKQVMSNSINHVINTETIYYKIDDFVKNSVELTGITMKLNHLEKTIEDTKHFLNIKNRFLREKNQEYIKISKQIIRVNKTMPSFFGRIVENINGLRIATNENIKFNKAKIKNKKALYSKLELIPIFANMIILVYLTLLIDRRILRLSKKITQKSQKLQDVLDAQESMVILTDGGKISMYNKYFTEFFSNEIMARFNETGECICKYFLEVDGYFSLSKIRNNQSWIEYLKNQDEKFRLVSIMNKNSQVRHFSIMIKEFKNKKYVISLTDITDIQTESKRYEILATYDNLTKIYNRQKFNDIFKYELNRQERYGEGLFIVMFDLDHFKKVNDTYGHNVGDLVLINVASTVNKAIRKQDTLARWGGEEFMILLPHTEGKSAYKVAEKIRVAIENIEVPGIPKVTASFGLLSCDNGMEMIDIFSKVDAALYKAKENGRNMVVKYSFDEEIYSLA